jgi:hypothetical protein
MSIDANGGLSDTPCTEASCYPSHRQARYRRIQLACHGDSMALAAPRLPLPVEAGELFKRETSWAGSKEWALWDYNSRGKGRDERIGQVGKVEGCTCWTAIILLMSGGFRNLIRTSLFTDDSFQPLLKHAD